MSILRRRKSNSQESLVVTNTIFLDADEVTLTLMALVPGQTNVGNAPLKIIQYRRQLHGSTSFGVTKDLLPQIPTGAPR